MVRFQPPRRVARLALLLALVCVAGSSLRGDAAGERYARLAAKLQCTCGCQQPILRACSNMNCEYKASIQNSLGQLAQRAKTADADDLILQSFVQEYGPDVLVVPPHSAFGAVAWLMPAAAALFGLLVIFAALKFWRNHPRSTASAPSNETRARVEAEVEKALQDVE